jgi:hypothetical protein
MMSLLLSQIKILAGTQSAPSAVREREVPSTKFHQKEKTPATTTAIIQLLLAENNLVKTRCAFIIARAARAAHACINFNKVKRAQEIHTSWKVYKPAPVCTNFE